MDKKDRQIENLKSEIERIKKNWKISKAQQFKKYNSLKSQITNNNSIIFPIKLDGCKIANQEQLLDFTKDLILERNGLKAELIKNGVRR